jgi:hypothetical protein
VETGDSIFRIEDVTLWSSSLYCDVLRHWRHTVRITNSFIYKFTQSVIPLCHICTAHNLTHQYSTEHYPCRPTTAKTLITNCFYKNSLQNSHYKLTQRRLAGYKNSWQKLLLSQSQSHIATDGQTVSKSWCRATSGAYDQIFFPFGIRNTSDSYVLHSVGRPLW